MRAGNSLWSHDTTNVVTFGGQCGLCSRRVYHGAVDAVKVIVAWGAFALFHSITVSEPYERWARRVMGEDRFRAYHRLLFTLYSAAATAAVLLYVRSLPDVPLYRLDGILPVRVPRPPIVRRGPAPVDAVGPEGVRRPAPMGAASERGRGSAGPQRTSLHREGVRAGAPPALPGCSLLLAFHPTQTRNSAATAAAVIAYFYIGTFLEERRIERKFGEAYREYQRRVPRFLPLPRP